MRSRPATIAAILLITGLLTTLLALGVGAGSDADTPTGIQADAHPAGVAADFTIGGMPAPSPFSSGFGYTAGQGGCSLSCITSGLAYPAARNAALRVETNTPAKIWISVWRGSDVWVRSTVGSDETTFTANFDDLQPNTTYQAMAVAQDANGFADHRYGSFTTRDEKLKLTLDAGAILLDPSTPVDVRLLVTAYHEDLADDQGWGLGCAASGNVETAPTTPGAFDASACITWINVAHWSASGQMAPVSLGGAMAKEVTLTIAPDLDVDFVVTFDLTLERVPA
ncbi:MAG: hypothetical protein KF906_01770 [Actinobacteria bacterium]|nr:hypothetical protein [Actinomycetota bacterium]